MPRGRQVRVQRRLRDQLAAAPLRRRSRRPGAGLDAAKFTTIARDDGTKQVAFFGHPLYFFAGDKAAGDTTGQGVGGKWYVVGADGAMIGAEAASPSAAAAGGVSVALADNALGNILVGENGMTLYIVHRGQRPASPSATATAPRAGRRSSPTRRPRSAPGLDAEDFATIKRDDGKSQVTFYGQPVYYFAGDKAAGDTDGQGAQRQVVRASTAKGSRSSSQPPRSSRRASAVSRPQGRRSGPAASLARLGRCASHTSVNDTPPQAPHGDSRRRSIPGARAGSISRSPAAARSRPTRTSPTTRCSTASP